jgi:uncharacterized MAPEG superfamily protein
MNGLSVELQMLWASAALGLVQIVLTVLATLPSTGLAWAMGARDAAPAGNVNTYACRLDRALKNFTETFAIFAAAALIANALGKHSHLSVLGAQLYFWCRLGYVPAYALGIPVVRTLLWTGAIVGIALVMLVICPGV